MKKLTVRGISTHEESKGEWKYGYLIEDEGVSYIINGVAEANDEYITIGEWCSVEPETLGISTGLPDEDGTEIFEGDIVRQVRTQPTTENEVIIGVVTMIEGAWLIMNDNKQWELYTSLHHQQHIVFMRISKKTISVLEVAFSILIVVPF